MAELFDEEIIFILLTDSVLTQYQKGWYSIDTEGREVLTTDFWHLHENGLSSIQTPFPVIIIK